MRAIGDGMIRDYHPNLFVADEAACQCLNEIYSASAHLAWGREGSVSWPSGSLRSFGVLLEWHEYVRRCGLEELPLR